MHSAALQQATRKCDDQQLPVNAIITRQIRHTRLEMKSGHSKHEMHTFRKQFMISKSRNINTFEHKKRLPSKKVLRKIWHASQKWLSHVKTCQESTDGLHKEGDSMTWPKRNQEQLI